MGWSRCLTNRCPLVVEAEGVFCPDQRVSYGSERPTISQAMSRVTEESGEYQRVAYSSSSTCHADKTSRNELIRALSEDVLEFKYMCVLSVLCVAMSENEYLLSTLNMFNEFDRMESRNFHVCNSPLDLALAIISSSPYLFMVAV